jgi:predicted permease
MAAFRNGDLNLTGGATPERIAAKIVSSQFFSVLGVQPLIGRSFLPPEDEPGSSPVVLIGEGLWKRRFGEDPGILGKGLVVNGKSCTVIGVIPSNLRDFGLSELFLTLGQWNDPTILDRKYHPGLSVIALLKPGATLKAARIDVENIARQLAEQYPDTNKGYGVVATPVADYIVGNVRPTLYLLFGAVGFVLLISCANVANLLLARSTVRRKEIAIRCALGAGRTRIVTQLLTESVLLATLGGALGLLLSAWLTDPKQMGSAVPGGLPRMQEIRTDGTVLAFALAISVLTGILFGMIPGLQSTKTALIDTLREGVRGGTSGRQRIRNILVIFEIAAALVLLVGAGLMIRTIARLSGVDPGFDARKLLTFQVALSPSKLASPSVVRSFFPQFLERIESIPGVESASLTMDLPLSDDTEFPFSIEGRPRPTRSSEMMWALLYPTSPHYLRTMKIPLLRGRFFTDRDTDKSPSVVVIDETMARSIFQREDPIGKRVIFEGIGVVSEIIGVGGHVKHWGLATDAENKIQYQLYMPYLQIPDQFMTLTGEASTYVVRSSISPLSLTTAVRGETLAMDKDQPLYNVRTMEQVVNRTLLEQKFSLLLLMVFAGAALALASVGIYGLISYSASQRVHELGINLALGAQRRDVLQLVVGQGMLQVLIGMSLGVAAALALTRLLRHLLFEVSSYDPLTFAGVVIILSFVAFLACYLPARRATMVDPVEALRYE